MGIYNDNWKKFFFDSQEGLGAVYDRVMFDRYCQRLVAEYNIKNVLDCPSFGMTGFSGINSLYLAKNGIKVTVCDNNPERLEWIKLLWDRIGLKADFSLVDYSNLQFDDQSFDLVWNVSSLWHINGNISKSIKELGRITNKCLFISVYNTSQLCYPVWRVIEPEFFTHIKEEYSDTKTLEKIFERELRVLNLKEKGYYVTTPWPGMAMKKEQIIDKILGKKKEEKDDIYDYKLEDTKGNIKMPTYVDDLMNNRIDSKVEKVMFLENSPNIFKKYWAHLRYWVYQR